MKLGHNKENISTYSNHNKFNPFACFLQERTKLDDMFLELKAKMT